MGHSGKSTSEIRKENFIIHQKMTLLKELPKIPLAED
jgi:hypothetical protein